MVLTFATIALLCGCGVVSTPAGTAALSAGLNVLPTTLSLQQGQTANFSIQNTSAELPACEWTSSNQDVLDSAGNGAFTAVGPGAATVNAACGATSGSASVSVPSIASTSGFTIKSGGTYSGAFSSDNPNIPAITIDTNQPVILENSTVSGRGDLIRILGTGSTPALGSKATIRNVTGTALDPGVAGSYRGAFVRNDEAASISVTNCTMTGVSFGIYLAPMAVSSITIENNQAFNLEDRPSDGKGGLIPSRAMKGHFIQFNNVAAINGADIAWNQVINTLGQASVEDIIDMDDSGGSSAQHPVMIHDNYVQGAFSTGSSNYTGSGIMVEGDSPLMAKTSGFIEVTNNEVVLTAGAGIAITEGHDIAMSGNRIVSCGIDSSGKWYAGLSGNAAALWNASASPNFFNNRISGTTGGLVRPDAGAHAMAADLWAPDVSVLKNNVASGNVFDNPCWTGGKVLSNQAELIERSNWNEKVQAAGQILGDTHVSITSTKQ